MERIDSRQEMPGRLRGAVIALGNFDGFHAGHQVVAGRAAQWARDEGRPFIIATFDPHPVRLFKPDAAPFRLTTLDQRARLFEAAGADAMLVFHFDAAFAAHEAENYIRLLAGHIGAAGVVTGGDFTFGAGRRGTVDMLAQVGPSLGLRAHAVEPVLDEGGEIISSSRIRALLRAGDCAGAERLLTRPFAIEGVVTHGDKRGRAIGFPTANIDMGDYLRPAYGIYAVEGVLPGGRVVGGAANLGIRPTFDPPKELLEPTFFDFSGDLYGQIIEVRLIEYLRGEERFASVDDLIVQMDRDCAQARQILAGRAPLA